MSMYCRDDSSATEPKGELSTQSTERPVTARSQTGGPPRTWSTTPATEADGEDAIERTQSLPESRQPESTVNDRATSDTTSIHIWLDGDIIRPLDIPRPKTYAESTNLALQHPEIATQILALPMPPKTSTVPDVNDKQPNSAKAISSDTFTNIKHSPSAPNWALAPECGDVGRVNESNGKPICSNTKRSRPNNRRDATRGKGATFGWLVAPTTGMSPHITMFTAEGNTNDEVAKLVMLLQRARSTDSELKHKTLMEIDKEFARKYGEEELCKAEKTNEMALETVPFNVPSAQGGYGTSVASKVRAQEQEDESVAPRIGQLVWRAPRDTSKGSSVPSINADNFVPRRPISITGNGMATNTSSLAKLAEQYERMVCEKKRTGANINEPSSYAGNDRIYRRASHQAALSPMDPNAILRNDDIGPVPRLLSAIKEESKVRTVRDATVARQPFGPTLDDLTSAGKAAGFNTTSAVRMAAENK
ncbi:hypothetical protein K474DRAFT_1671082 [Panus rudis PR-1116 ss-1]|nr:hypothetical protein K474DRAFT_1671082 [Panus rudis PR-1116 ss-1]